MVQDEFEMENQGYEEENWTRSSSRNKRGYFAQSSNTSHDDNKSSRSSPVIQEIIANNPPLRSDPESHVYEDIVISGLENSTDDSSRLSSLNSSNCSNSSNSANNNRHVCREVEDKDWSKNVENEGEKNLRNLTKPATCFSSNETENSSNFHRNLTIPLRRPIGTIETGDTSRFSCRVTNRERTRCSPPNEKNDSSIYESSIGSLTIVDDDLTKSTKSTKLTKSTINDVVDKPGRRRRKKDCKHCKSKANNTGGINDNFLNHHEEQHSFKDSSTSNKIRASVNNEINVEKTRLEPIFALSDGKLALFNSQRVNFLPIQDGRTNSTFSISNNSNSILPVDNSPKSLNYEKNETDVRLVSVELTDDRALITPQKHRPGMKVNSIYSQEHWNTKDVPIFLTDVKEQNFQRAYSLPTRAQTPSSQNRVNLRRSVRGEPPPHPARLRKNRHGWTLHFARPLDGTGCTRSIVLLLIAILALLAIGGIALYIVFEPEKLEIIQQYLRSSTRNVTTETNSTFAPSLLGYEANLEITTFSLSNVPLTDIPTGLPRETTFFPETETDPAPTTTEIITQLDRNSTRHCDDCYDVEVCVALVDEQVPICRTGPDPLDPTGCSGLCLINKQKCHRLDVDAFRCVEVEHYCLDDEWTCSNTLCIPLVKHCDGHMNCYDHSDEYDCACDLQTHFQCGNETSCLPLERRCDGKIDCWDATDEINCTIGQDLGWSCPSSSEFTCSNGECILKARFCDGLRDCTDGSDEPHGCQGRCNKHEFSCLNGRCITKSMKCNGIDDCGDNSDEQHCRDRIFKKPAA